MTTSVDIDPLAAVGGPGDIDGHYAALGADPAAPIAELRKRYRALLREWHPDHNPARAATHDLTARLTRLDDAAKVLFDAAARAAYDTRSALPPLVVTVRPGSTIKCSTFIGTARERVVEVAANRPVTSIDISKLDGKGWSAQAFSGAGDVVLVLEITFDATRVGTFTDAIELRLDEATLRLAIELVVAPAPTSSSARSTSASGATRPTRSTSGPTPPAPPRRLAPTPPTPSKWRIRCIVAAWVTALTQALFASAILSNASVASHFPSAMGPILTSQFVAPAALGTAIVAAVITYGFRRWRWATGPAAVILLSPGIVSVAVIAAVFSVIAFAIVVVLLVLIVVLSVS